MESHDRNGRRCWLFKAPLLFSASNRFSCLVRRDAEVELLPAGTDLGQ